jgi:hypothetical protein
MTRPARSLALVSLAALLSFAGRCYEKNDFSPTAPPTTGALTLATAGGATTLAADGVSKLRIVARVSPEADPDKRTVLFSTSAGTLVGTAVNGKVPVAADSNGEASIELTSAAQVGQAVVTAEVMGVPGLARSLVVSFVAANADELIRFTAAPASAHADGASISTFTVRIASSFPAGTQVTFATTAGTFQPGGAATITVPVAADFTASADLASPATLGQARVSATVQGFTREARIEFTRALPNLITVSTNGTFAIPPSTSAGVSVIGTFLRDIGKVTAGTVATFRATTDTGAPIGFFNDVTTVKSDGTATATFLPGQTAYRGRVTITVGVEGSSVVGTAQIEIRDP